MTCKPLLVLRPNEFSSFTSFYLESFWKQFFDIACYDSQTTYDKKNTIFVVWWQNVRDDYVHMLLNNNCKVAVDNLWENLGNVKRDDLYIIEHRNWFWFNESLWWTALGYNCYVPQKQINKLALMPIRRQSQIRTYIVNELTDFLDKFIWSYGDQQLPDDNNTAVDNQRYVNFNWYNTTYLSLVVETSQGGYLPLTEKSYKPISYYHPYMIIGQPRALLALRNNGFETFENLFDESYDQELDFVTRLNIIKDNLTNIKWNQSYDQLTLDKLTHNHNHFYNTEKILKLMKTEIIFPLLNYAEA